MRIPIATYRLQFNAQFTFRDATRIVPYLHELGITDVYASPLLRARSGSTHGYDIVDANALNPELGTEDDFAELRGELDRFGMGLLLDIVPNHMAASHENAWWVSVLENGPQSRFLYYFDIDWRDDKVLLPILGRPYGETLESGAITLGYDADGLFFAYYDKRLPLAPHSYRIVLESCVDADLEVRDLVQNETVIANSRFLKETLQRLRETSEEFRRAMDESIASFNGDPDRLDRLLQVQWYRLAFWRIASETINYRRFFDVTDLVGIRVENPEVFEARNRLIFDLIANGAVTGVRIDHIDGLHDPIGYLNKLQHRLSDDFYVVVEKILSRDESLPPSFRCAGTTGYDFLDTLNALFVDPTGLAQLTDFYQRYTGLTASYEDVEYERKKQVIDLLFAGEMRALGKHLAQLAVADRNARDFAPSELLAALVEITACMPVYRTYISDSAVSDADRAVLTHAIAEARRRAQHVDARLFQFLELVLLLEPPPYIASQREKWLELVMKWQQFTGRVMAKGVEDTTFYNYNALLSLNEVGGHPARGAFDPVAEFHARNEAIARAWPHTMNATSTHDTKRSEDVRARINVLSEMPEAWDRAVRKWSRMNASLKRDGVPDRNEELMIYQTLIGIGCDGVESRMREFLVKAAREAKTHTSWIAVNEQYEKSLTDFASAILAHDSFLGSFRRFHQRVAYHGFLNSLAQVVLKICSPGVPDFYQGTELWDYSLVDPDNRRPVDYAHRASLLAQLGPPAQLLNTWHDGRVKLFVTARALRTRMPESYRAVDTGTPHAVAFLRGDDVLVIVPRLTTSMSFGDHALDVPGRWRNVFTEEVHESLALEDVFASFPVAILTRL